ncbi:hypothetical protein DL239_08165 [Sedimentitalea sp. CY04]|uniref:DUF2189 domain-containing protein n=1 Tax=Parasedimentitalea denitrificans TaxID=2211118 RepID=A0ABX0W5U6_9RHOB|nr:DUF2189 domain-containing protein [Sedimentitalea sp. CY04]NIZ60947.1 hypothetical protein [Sedimentitalea sp. CY04]
MARTIGNPLSWLFQHAETTSHHISASVEQMGSELTREMPKVRRLELSDLKYALKAGADDFAACRSDAMFLVLLYPLIGLVMAVTGFSMNLLPLLVPMIMGFAIIGPLAAVGLYEMSSRREAGFEPKWMDAFDVIRSPSFGAILMLGLYLTVLFVGWLICANSVYTWTLGPEAPSSLAAFATDTFTTPAGWVMIIVGSGLGALFALAALAISVVSFPLLLDRHVGLPVAVITSVRVLRASPVVTLAWGALIGTSLVIASIPLLLGLVVVVPIFGHATWHLYRRAVE